MSNHHKEFFDILIGGRKHRICSELGSEELFDISQELDLRVTALTQKGHSFTAATLIAGMELVYELKQIKANSKQWYGKIEKNMGLFDEKFKSFVSHIEDN